MNRKAFLTKLMAVIGTVLVCLPLLAPLLLSLILWFEERIFRFDYLMPAELFVFVLAGGLLLIWAAWRAHLRLKPIALGLGVAVGMLVGGQTFAVVTGLASGAREPAGWAWTLLLASLAVFWLALILLCFGAVGLLIDLMRPTRLEKE